MLSCFYIVIVFCFFFLFLSHLLCTVVEIFNSFIFSNIVQKKFISEFN